MHHPTGRARPRAKAKLALARRSLPLAAFVAASLLAARAQAMTAEGTLITNLASGTYSNPVSGVNTTISYGVTATVLVVQPMVLLNKTAAPTLQSVAGTVTFCITFSNSSRYVSAFNIVIRDILPTNMRFIDWTGREWVDDPTAIAPKQYSAADVPALGAPWGWTTGNPPVGYGPTTSLRWVVPVLGPGRSGFACYTASVM